MFLDPCPVDHFFKSMAFFQHCHLTCLKSLRNLVLHPLLLQHFHKANIDWKIIHQIKMSCPQKRVMYNKCFLKSSFPILIYFKGKNFCWKKLFKIFQDLSFAKNFSTTKIFQQTGRKSRESLLDLFIQNSHNLTW